MLALRVLQLAMLVSPSGRWAYGPATNPFRRCGRVQCGACTDFCVGWLGAARGDADKAESRLLPNIRDKLTESEMQCMCEALQARLGLSEAELRKVVLGLPPVLGLSVEGNVLPTIDFLQGELGLSDKRLRERIVGFPAILSYSIERRLQPRVELCNEMGLPAERMLFNFASRKPEDFDAACARCKRSLG